MSYGTIKMYYRPWGPCSAPAVQDLGKRFDHFSQKQPLLNFSPDVSQLIEMAPSILKNTVSTVFGTVIVCVTLVGISSDDMRHICR
jgi:hypothetical protein